MRPEKPHVSASQLDTFSKCGEQWRRAYIEKEKVPPGIALVTGTAVHKVGEKIQIHKLENDGEILTLEEVKDTARDELVKATEERGLLLNSDERKKGVKAVVGQAKDESISLATLYHSELASVINPLSVESIEKKFNIALEGYPYDLTGRIDIEDSLGFRDLKTSGKSVVQASVDRSLQYTFYAMWYWRHHNGEFPKQIVQDTLVKTKKPKYQPLITKRGQKDFNVLAERLVNFSECVEKGVFPPATPLSWWCSPKWCGYYETCRYTR